LNDPNLKFRCFICASLNHHFLEEWIVAVYQFVKICPIQVWLLIVFHSGRNSALLSKYFLDGAFLVTCPNSFFQELALSLQPLVVLPFRLFMAFEAVHRHNKSPSQSPSQQHSQQQSQQRGAVSSPPPAMAPLEASLQRQRSVSRASEAASVSSFNVDSGYLDSGDLHVRRVPKQVFICFLLEFFYKRQQALTSAGPRAV
jgi:hypothetical protein